MFGRIWSVRQEALWVITGLLTFSITYYRRIPFISVLGLIILVATGIFWGYSIRRVHPMGLKEFRIVKDNWRWHVFIAMVASVLGLVYSQVYVYLTRGHWMNLNFGGSIPLVISILVVVSAEELFFNGYLLTRMRAFSSSLWLRPLIVMMIFSLYKVAIHLWEGRPPIYYVELFVAETLQSYPASWWSDRTGSLVTSFLVHLIWDLLMYGYRTNIPAWVF